MGHSMHSYNKPHINISTVVSLLLSYAQTNTPYKKTFKILVGPQRDDGSLPSSQQILDREPLSEV